MRAVQMICLMAVFFPVCAVGVSAGADEDPLVVKTTSGRVRGKRVARAHAFLGIPYARPPIGDLRWRPPVDPEPWTGIRDARSYPTAATQRIPNPTGVREASEDCLYLSVLVPVKRSADRPLPVMMYLHGGSNVFGSPTRFTEGVEDLLVGQRHNIVLVTVQFRLGSLGFLAHPALTAESEHGSSGNYGFLDQIAALRWIQRNIRQFGGDPGRVTVFGGSSGSIDTGSLVASPLARGLIHGAIMQSWPPAAPRLAEREQNQGLVFAREAGCDGAKDVAAALRAVPWQKLVEIEVKLGPTPAGRGFNPKVDGWALLDHPLEVFRAGKHNHIPFMIGAQAQDVRGRVRRPIRNEEDFRGVVTELLGALVSPDDVGKQLAKLRKLYPVGDYANHRAAYIDLYNDFLHIAPDRRTAVAMAATQDEPVYWYVFSHTLSGEYARYGADHPLINQFVFQLIRMGRLPRWYRGGRYRPTENDFRVADYVLDYWTSFAANGHLDGVSSPPWPRVTPERPVAQIIRVPVESRVHHRAERLAYWDEIMKAYQEATGR